MTNYPQRSRIWDTLLKWKRPEDITIDFRYVVNETPDVECGLHVSILGKEVPFRPELFKKAHMLKNIRNMDEAVPHGSIIECRVFVEDTDLDIYFIRQRKDKESPNSMHVALDNLHAIMYPVTAEMLTTSPQGMDEYEPTGKRVDRFWLSIGDFVFYTSASLSGKPKNDFPNQVEPLCIPQPPQPAPPPAVTAVAPERVLWCDAVSDTSADSEQTTNTLTDILRDLQVTSVDEQAKPPVLPPTVQTRARPVFAEAEFLKIKVDDLRQLAKVYNISHRGLRDDLRERLRAAGIIKHP